MSIIIMILLLSVLILVHELGHFLAARMFGITVDKFGFGLPVGPTLWQKKIGDTTYVIHALLLGGYVSFPDDDENSDIPEDSEKRFKNRPIWQKMIVISAGVVANVVCAFAFVLLTAALWGNLPSGNYDIYIKDIVAEKCQSVWDSGLQKGDKIVEINGSPINTKYGLYLYSQMNKENDGKVTEKAIYDNYNKLKSINQAYKEEEVIPQGVVIRLPQMNDEAPVQLSKNMLKGIEMPQDTEITLNEKQIKLRDNLQESDDKRIYISDGETTLDDLAHAMSDGKKPLHIKVLRNGKIIELSTIYPNKEGVIGVMMDLKEILTPVTGVKSAFVVSAKYLYNETHGMIVILKQLFTGKIPLKNLHGIILVTKIGGDTITHDGIFYGLLLIAAISMNLAIINFLPIPALDGGHFMFLVIEKITGKPLDEKAVNLVSNICFMMLILLMVFVIFNDIFVLVTQ